MENKLDMGQFEWHTPGRWKAIKRGEFSIIASRIQQYAKWPVAVDVLDRDAALIAAAPDLLAELKEARKEIEELRWVIEKSLSTIGFDADPETGEGEPVGVLLELKNILEGKE